MRIALFALVVAASAQDWPSFRGPVASGVADGQNLPVQWDTERRTNVLWKTAVHGLAHSSPVVWGDRVFLTTAVSSKPGATLQTGTLRGGHCLRRSLRAPVERAVPGPRHGQGPLGANRVQRRPQREAPHQIHLCQRHSGNRWPRRRCIFRVARAVCLYALAVTCCGSGTLAGFDVGAYDAPEFEWGTASSPILYKDLVIVQCDQQKGSFLTALDAKTRRRPCGGPRRDELPSWGTPAIFQTKSRVELVTNGSNFIRGYDPASGKELWRLGGSSKITAPTPVSSDDVIIVASGRRPEAPIFAIRAGANGDITLPSGQSRSRSVAWSKGQRGPYMPTPLIYGGYVYRPGQRRHLRLLRSGGRAGRSTASGFPRRVRVSARRRSRRTARSTSPARMARSSW